MHTTGFLCVVTVVSRASTHGHPNINPHFYNTGHLPGVLGATVCKNWNRRGRFMSVGLGCYCVPVGTGMHMHVYCKCTLYIVHVAWFFRRSTSLVQEILGPMYCNISAWKLGEATCQNQREYRNCLHHHRLHKCSHRFCICCAILAHITWALAREWCFPCIRTAKSYNAWDTTVNVVNKIIMSKVAWCCRYMQAAGCMRGMCL